MVIHRGMVIEKDGRNWKVEDVWAKLDGGEGTVEYRAIVKLRDMDSSWNNQIVAKFDIAFLLGALRDGRAVIRK